MRILITVRFLCNNFVLQFFFKIQSQNMLPDFCQAVSEDFVTCRSDRETLLKVILLFHS